MAKLSGVSRSIVSLIKCGKSSPTVSTLWTVRPMGQKHANN
ncbi:hypothetical protein [uncultured Planktomarina sp.]